MKSDRRCGGVRERVGAERSARFLAPFVCRGISGGARGSGAGRAMKSDTPSFERRPATSFPPPFTPPSSHLAAAPPYDARDRPPALLRDDVDVLGSPRDQRGGYREVRAGRRARRPPDELPGHRGPVHGDAGRQRGKPRIFDPPSSGTPYTPRHALYTLNPTPLRSCSCTPPHPCTPATLPPYTLTPLHPYTSNPEP
jgi:hypothetical protein